MHKNVRTGLLTMMLLAAARGFAGGEAEISVGRTVWLPTGWTPAQYVSVPGWGDFFVPSRPEKEPAKLGGLLTVNRASLTREIAVGMAVLMTDTSGEPREVEPRKVYRINGQPCLAFGMKNGKYLFQRLSDKRFFLIPVEEQDAPAAKPQRVPIYLANDSPYFHRENCRRLGKSAKLATLSDAIRLGRKPCPECHPPVIEMTDPKKPSPPPESGKGAE